MAYKKITKSGELFMTTIANKNGVNGLIRGKNKYEIPFTYDVTLPSELVASIVDEDGNLITNNIQFINYLINLYNKYAKLYDLDANILVAQAYAESGLKVWNYAPYPSTATGLTQFLIGTMYEVVVENKYGSTPKFTESEINRMIINFEQPYNENSYKVGASENIKEGEDNFINRSRSRKNRYFYLMNAMNNPDLMIKAQCRYMKYIANRNNNLASNTLFAYNRGSSYSSDTYTGIINLVKGKKGNNYIEEGLKYVEKIFGVLGDKDNEYTNVKPKGIFFGYDLDLDKNKFDSFRADIK